MTIQAAFNEITKDLGGTPSTDGTIAGAIDALNDTLAGSDQDRGNSIEDAVRLLGEHIGGGGGAVKVALLNSDNPFGLLTNMRVYDTLPAEGQQQIQTYTDNIPGPEGEMEACCFDAVPGNPYVIVYADTSVSITGGELMLASETIGEFPVNISGDGSFYMVGPIMDAFAMLSFSGDPTPSPDPDPK